MLIDFRDVLANDLKDPEFRREFVVALYEEDGMKGVRAALDEIARADTLNGVQIELTPTNSKKLSDFETLEKEMNRLGLEFRLTRKGEK